MSTHRDKLHEQRRKRAALRDEFKALVPKQADARGRSAARRGHGPVFRDRGRARGYQRPATAPRVRA